MAGMERQGKAQNGRARSEHTLRPYQTTALDAIYAGFKDDPLFLFQGITGCGKTLIICRLINRYVDKRCLILVNKQELVKQFHSILISQTEVDDIGICCASSTNSTWMRG